MSIFILKQELNMWEFVSDDKFINETLRCSECGYVLNNIYSYIIRKLHEAEFLPDNYQSLCCMCDKVKKTIEHYSCSFCDAPISFEYIRLDYDMTMKPIRTYRVVCKTKKCKFKKRMFTL